LPRVHRSTQERNLRRSRSRIDDLLPGPSPEMKKTVIDIQIPSSNATSEVSISEIPLLRIMFSFSLCYFKIKLVTANKSTSEVRHVKQERQDVYLCAHFMTAYFEERTSFWGVGCTPITKVYDRNYKMQNNTEPLSPFGSTLGQKYVFATMHVACTV